MRPVLLTVAVVVLAAAPVEPPREHAAVERAMFPDGAAIGDGWTLAAVGPIVRREEGYGVCGRRAIDPRDAPMLRADYDGASALLGVTVGGARTAVAARAWASRHRSTFRGCGTRFLWHPEAERLPTTVETFDGTYPGVTCEQFTVAEPVLPFRSVGCRVVSGRVVVFATAGTQDDTVDVVGLASRLADLTRRRVEMSIRTDVEEPSRAV